MHDIYQTLAPFYDAENQDLTEDLLLYGTLLAETGAARTLDIGCGSGRVALHLAAEGARVVGFDLSATMLERAAPRLTLRPDLAGHVAFCQADVTDFTFSERFDLAIFAYNGFMHLLRQADQRAALRSIANALNDDGLLIIDLPNAAEIYAAPDEVGLVYERTFTDPETGCAVMQCSISQLERATQILTTTWVYDLIDHNGTVRRTLAPQTLRYVFAAEMDLLLDGAGLRRIEFYGDYDRAPFGEGEPRMIVLAEKRED